MILEGGAADNAVDFSTAIVEKIVARAIEYTFISPDLLIDWLVDCVGNE